MLRCVMPGKMSISALRCARLISSASFNPALEAAHRSTAQKKTKIAVAMSGGVDSTVAAWILSRDPTYDVVGVYMKNWDEIEETGVCQSEAEFAKVCQISDALNIPCHRVDFVKEYWHSVFTTFLESYEVGLTPNPDVLCNRFVKFGAFYNYAVENLGVEKIATGHYAQIVESNNIHQIVADGNKGCQSDNRQGLLLARGDDATKDQSYFLSGMDHGILKQIVFPIGQLPKAQVKETATRIGMHSIAQQKESMGICFIGKRKMGPFLRSYIDEGDPAKVVILDSETGSVVKELPKRHSGLRLLTIGQRATIGGMPSKYYVAGKCISSNILYITGDTNSPLFYSDSFVARDMCWTLPPGVLEEMESSPGCRTFDVRVQIRHGCASVRGTVCFPSVEAEGKRVLSDVGWSPNGEGSDPNQLFEGEVFIELEQKLRAIVPGQAVAIFDVGDNVCLGGGTICDVMYLHNK